MTTLQHQSVPAHGEPDIRLDNEGFLVEGSAWSREIARHLAHQEGLEELTFRHWKLVDHMRDHYLGSDALPSMRLVCRATGIDRSEVQRLFGGCRSIWRIAGLPNPGSEALAYMH